jgi:hypothetical protein
MKKIKKLVKYSILLLIFSVFLYFFIDIKEVMIILFSLLLLTSYGIYKEKIGQELIIAFLISIAWCSYYFYEYNTNNFFIGKINIFPLICFTFGLVFLREIYERINGKYKFFKISFIYLLGLFLVEYFGYYLLNIRLITSFPSLLNLGIIHAPFIMKLFYVFIGPMYILITDYLKVK